MDIPGDQGYRLGNERSIMNVMLSLAILIALLGGVGALALRYGVDSRRDDGRRNW
jgi:hypothetical protein